MIDYIRGKVAEAEPTRAVIDCGGVGYEVIITLPDYGPLQHAQQKGESVKLYVHEIIRDDAHTLYGFTGTQVRSLFRLLIGVSGVGPGSARLILSALSGDDLCECIETGDHTRLKTVKGIGTKTAQRIVVDLKGKLKDDLAFAVPGGAYVDISGPASSGVESEAVAALQILGYTSEASKKAVRILLKQEPDMTVEQLIRSALRTL